MLAREGGADVPVIGELTTLDAAGSPHRNFGLAQTFEKLYIEMLAAGSQVRIPLARLAVCKK
jgi:ABC-type transport system involved in cytochrome c biogenesis ATPase subunit